MSNPIVFILVEETPQDYRDFKADKQWYSNYFAQQAYQRYLSRFQPYRWIAKAANGEVIARSSENYFNRDDCLHAIELIATSPIWLEQPGVEHRSRLR